MQPGRLAATLALALGLAGAPAAPAAAQVVCLDCFTGLLATNPFAAPVVLPRQALFIGGLGLVPPLDAPSYLPSLQAKYGIFDGTELVASVGNEPSLGFRATALRPAEQVVVLGAARGGYSQFRQEWLAVASAPVLVDLGGGASARLEPQVTLNQLSGTHVALDLALAQPLWPGTALSLVLQPDYRPVEQLWSGMAALGVNQALGNRMGAYVLASALYITDFTPFVSAGLTWAPPPFE